MAIHAEPRKPPWGYIALLAAVLLAIGVTVLVVKLNQHPDQTQQWFNHVQSQISNEPAG